MNKIQDMIYGLAIGDAVGVPYEFTPIEVMNKNPAMGMVGNLSYSMVSEGNWSDDTSLTLALMGAINEENGNIKASTVYSHFSKWLHEDYYTSGPPGMFDVGNSTQAAIDNKMGNTGEWCNGNGSLMRIAPMAFYLKNIDDVNVRFEMVKMCSGFTHGHIRSILCCFFYVEFIREMLLNEKRESDLKKVWFNKVKVTLAPFLKTFPEEIRVFNSIFDLNPSKVKSSTYVMDTLNLSFYCFLNTDNYKECVLKAVNYGEDTDTSAAIAGALAGVYYGIEFMPREWIEKLKNKKLINQICNQWEAVVK